MYCEYVQCFQLMLIKPLMMVKTGRNMLGNLCIYNELVTSEGIYIYILFAYIVYVVTGQDANS
jgi:hypothetical protein